CCTHSIVMHESEVKRNMIVYVILRNRRDNPLIIKNGEAPYLIPTPSTTLLRREQVELRWIESDIDGSQLVPILHSRRHLRENRHPVRACTVASIGLTQTRLGRWVAI